ncbi:TPA: WYL domain-containing protein [Photobacterium damselae]
MENRKVGIWLGLGIFFYPVIFSWLTLRNGYSIAARLISLSWMFFICFIFYSSEQGMAPVLGLLILGLFSLAVFKIGQFIWNLATKRKEKMLELINDDSRWAEYCNKKGFTPSMQKAILATYGVSKQPVYIHQKVKSVDQQTEQAINAFSPNKQEEITPVKNTKYLEQQIEDMMIRNSSKSDRQKKLVQQYQTATTHAQQPPMGKDKPLDDFDNKLITLWAGTTNVIEFTYQSYNSPKKRRQVRPTEVCFNDDGDFYIKGYCLEKNEPRTFRQSKFTAKIKVGSQRFDFDEWCADFLGVDVYESCPNCFIHYT